MMNIRGPHSRNWGHFFLQFSFQKRQQLCGNIQTNQDIITKAEKLSQKFRCYEL